MSTLKKVISLVLCAAIFVGSFALVGNIAPVASATEETSKVKSYADLVAQYGQNGDGFVYTGIEFYESNGKLTDYYVKSGDELTARVFIKSNMYVGESYIITLFDNKFFDVKLAGGPNASVDGNGYTSNYDNGTINANHPIRKNNKSPHIITSINITNVGWIKNLCGFKATYLAETDLVQSNTETDITVSQNAYDATSDEWVFEYYVKVKSGLEDGKTGIVSSPETLWHASINKANGKHDARKKAYIPVVKPADYAAGKKLVTDTTTMAAAMDQGVIDHFVTAMDHEFTIGDAPAAPEEVKISATFIAENQKDTIETKEAVVGSQLEFPASVENQIGWVIVKEALTTPGTMLEPDAEGNYAYTVKDADVTFLRVLSTTEFPVEISLDAQASEITVDAEKLAAAGVEYDESKVALRVMLSIGESFDLASIEDAIAKVGNEIAGWDITATAPSTVDGSVITLNTVNGVFSTPVTLSSKALWNPELYTVNIYLDKDSVGTADPIKTFENVAYNTKVQYGAITNAITDKKFAGWYNAANDELISTANNYQFEIKDDLNVYAAWSDYANVATFMVRDYANGEWVEINKIIDKTEAESVTVSAEKVNEIITAACADENITLQGVYTANPDENADSKVNGILQLAPGVYQAAALTYSGHQTFYIATTLACEVTWMIPAYNAETNTFDYENATVVATDKVATAAYAGAADPYAAASKLNKAVDTPTGYVLAYWKDAATGEKVELNESGAYIVSADTRTATLIAEFELVEYTVAFNLRNGATPDLLMMTSTVSLGDEIIIDGAGFTLNGEATVLPEIGLDNEDQADGGYELLAGYKFAGWSFGTDSNAAAIEFPVKLTADIIKKNFANGVININAMWEAEEFVLSFYITNAEGEEELFASYNVKVGSAIASYRTVTEEIAAAVNAKAAEGEVFSNIWYNKETDAPDTSMTNMPAKDVSYYAVYTTATVKVYVDYNYLPEANLEETMKLYRVDGKEILLYGADIKEVKEEAPYYSRSFETMVMNSVNSNTSPETPSEIIGWNIYHIGAGEDPYTAEWKAGVNEEGTTIAQSTLIFQPIWKAHKDMMFRFHDTDGDIYFAVGKDFSFHYWNKGVIVEKYSDTVINTKPEDNIVLFYTISIDWSAFSIRLDAFPIPKYIFTPDGFVAFFQMLPTLFESLLG